MLIEEPAPPPVAPTPVRLRLPLSRPWLAMALVVINVLIHILMSLAARRGFVAAFLGGADMMTLVRFGAKVNALIVQGEVWRLFTAMFLHIGLLHLLFNQYALAIFGRELESVTGTLRFAVIYLLSGLAGSLLSFAFSPNPSAGASGAIFGLIGAMTLFFWRNREILGPYAQQRMRNLLFLIFINIALFGQARTIDNWAHIGGLLTGALVALVLVPAYRVGERRGDTLMLTRDGSPLLAGAVLGGGLLLLSAAFLVARSIAPLVP